MPTESLKGLLAAGLCLASVSSMYLHFFDYEDLGIVTIWMLTIGLLGIATLPKGLIRRAGAAVIVAITAITAVDINIEHAESIQDVGAWIPMRLADDSLESLIKVTQNKNIYADFSPYLCLKQYLEGTDIVFPAKAEIDLLAIRAISRARIHYVKVLTPPSQEQPIATCAQFSIAISAEADNQYIYNNEHKLFINPGQELHE